MSEKKPFNRYSVNEAYKIVGIRKLLRWEISYQPLTPSAIFQESLKRLDAFDLTFNERCKEVLIDEILQEALSRRPRLKVWKEAPLVTEMLSGRVEYLFAEKIDILERPFLCIAEAKKDDFEQRGLAQCLVEMKACQLLNLKDGFQLDVYGIVTNGSGWQFYKLTQGSQVYQSRFFVLDPQPDLFGVLDVVLKLCEQNLDRK